MVQDIGEGRFHCEYRPERPAPEDALIAVRGGELLLTESGGVYDFPRVSQLETISRETERPYYLFSIDGYRFFLCRTPVTEAPEGMVFRHLMQLRLLFADDWRVFAGATAWHLGDWYASRRYCGACGAPAHPPYKQLYNVMREPCYQIISILSNPFSHFHIPVLC